MSATQLYAAITPFTDAEIKLWPTTTPTLVPAVPNKIIRPISGDIQAKLVDTYTNVSSTDGYIQINESVTNGAVLIGPVSTGAPSFLDDFSALFGGYGAGSFDICCPLLLINSLKTDYIVPAALTGLPATGALTLQTINAGDVTGNFTGGHVDNIIVVTILYRLADAL